MEEREYEILGEKRIVNGETLYSCDYFDNGCFFGTYFKDEKAFYENPKEVCYIPEAAFDDLEGIEIDGKTFYKVDEDITYSRENLEELIEGEFDGGGEPIDVEGFFQELDWQCPETLLMDITY